MAEIITKDCKEYRIWDKVNGVWNRLFFKTNAKSVEADDGKDLQTKLGAIDGITSDLSGESETVAASIKCINQLNDSLGGLSFYEDEDGNKYVVGADSVPKKLGSGSTIINLIIHQIGSGFVPITTAPNFHTSGIIVNKDEGAFTLQNENEFVCNTDGELVVFGMITNAYYACTFSVVKNGNEISVPIFSQKGNTTIEVSKGDVLKFKFGVTEEFWITGSFAIAL